MAPTRRSTRAKSTDQGAAASSPSTRATRARPATKTYSPVAKPRAKQTRKTAPQARAVPEVGKEEEEEKVREEQKPKGRSTRRGAAKTQTVPRAEGKEKKEIISQEEIEDIVAVTTRRSGRSASVASLQSPAKSRAARGRVAKKVAPAKRIRGAVVEEEDNEEEEEEEEEVVPEATPTKTSRGRKPLIEATNSHPPTPSTEVLDAVVVRSRSKREDPKTLKNPIDESVAAENSTNASATPSWARKRGGRRAKVADEAAGDNLGQHAKAVIGLTNVDVEDTKVKDAETEPMVGKGRGRKKGMKLPQDEVVVGELETTIAVVEPGPVPKGRGNRRGKKAEAVPEEPEAIAEDIAIDVAEPGPVLKEKSKRGKKADAIPDIIPEGPQVIIEDTAVEVAKPEPAPRGRVNKRGKKADVISKEPEDVAQPEPVLRERPSRKGKQANAAPGESEAIIEETAVVAESEPAPRGKGRKGKKVDPVPEEPDAIIEETTIDVTGPELAARVRGSRRGNKIDAVPEDTAADPEPVVAKGKGRGKGKKVAEEIEAVVGEPESVVEELWPVTAKGGGRKKGKKVDTIVAEPETVVEDTEAGAAEPEPVVARRKGGRRAAKTIEEPKTTVEDTKIEVAGHDEPSLPKGRGRQVVQVEIMDTSLDQTADAETEAEKADAVVGCAETTSQEPRIGDTQTVVIEEPAVKSKVRRKGKKAAPAKKGTRGRKIVAELPDVEMSDTEVQPQGAEAQPQEIEAQPREAEVQPQETEAQPQETEAQPQEIEAQPQETETQPQGTGVQTQETEVDVEMEPIATTTNYTGPSIKDSGVFLENEPMAGGGFSVDKLEPVTGKSDFVAVEEVATEAEAEVVAPESGAAAEKEPILTAQSEVTVEVEVEAITGLAVVVESNAGQTRVTTDETEVGIVEFSKPSTKSPGSSRKRTPKGKGTTKIVAPAEQDVEMGETSVEGEKAGPNIESEPAIGKSSTDIEMPASGVGIELKELVRTPKPRKKAKKSAMATKKERQAKSAAKKAKGSMGGFEALDTSSDIFYDGVSPKVEKKETKETEGEEATVGRELAEDEEDEPDLPRPFSSPVTKLTIVLSPRRASPDPDLDPIKTPVPSSPIDHRMSHPLNSSPIRQNGPDPVVLASPRLVTTPSSSPSKKRSTPNTRTPINRLPGSGVSFGRNLEDSRDVRSISTPARGRNSSVASSPIMMPPATPNVVAGDARSPTKHTPTKESEVVRDVLDRVDEPSLLVGGVTNINSSPMKNSTPIRAGFGIEKSSPVGRLNFGGSDISQSSPLVGRLQINDPSLLLSSPLAVSPKTFSPTKTQQNSPTRSSPLKHSPLAMGSTGFFGEEILGEDSFTSYDGDYSHIDEPDDDEEGEDDYQDQETFGYGEGAEVEEKGDQQPKILCTTEYEFEDDNVDFDATIDESRLFKLAEKAMLEGDARTEQLEEHEEEEVKEGEKDEVMKVATGTPDCNFLTSRVSDFEVSCLEQVHPEFGQAETRAGNVQTVLVEEGAADINEKEAADTGGEREQVGNGDVAEGDLTFSDVVVGEDSIPSSPILDITSPMKFGYRPTSEIFPSNEFAEAEEALREGPFSPIDMDFFGDRSFDTSAADWREYEEEDDEEEEETEPDVNSPGGRLRHFRASSPPNIWPDEVPGSESVDSEASPVPKTSVPWEESDFDFSEEFIRPPTESPEPGGELSFDFSENKPSPGSPVVRGSAADTGKGETPLPTAEGQTSSPTATGGISQVDFQAGGVNVEPIVKAKESKDIADAWLGKKGLRPKEELSAPKQLANDKSEEVDEEDITEMKGGKRARAAGGDVEHIKKARWDTEDIPELPQAPGFLLNNKGGAKTEATAEKGRRQTFGGRPMAKLTGPSKRRKSFPEGPTAPDRQSYLYASDPERILRHWAQHEKDQATAVPIAPNSPLLSAAVGSVDSVIGPAGNASPKPVVRPSPMSTRPRRIRSVSRIASSSPAASGPPSSPPGIGGKRKADESLETERASKSSIPVSRRLARPLNNNTQEEVDLVLKNTAHNALYSCRLDYEPIKKSGKRPPSLDFNGVQRLANEARRKRKEAEELGLILRPGEEEAFIAVEEDGKKRIKWDGQLEYDCGTDLPEKPHTGSEPLSNKSILAVKPRLNIHGNWVPIPGVPPLKIPEELVVVKKIVYKGEEIVKKGRK